MSLSCRKHSFIYQSLSITTAADPLSADLITMSLRFLSDLRACRRRSREVKLSRTGSGFTVRKSCSTASKKCLVRFLDVEEEESKHFSDETD